VISVIGRTYFGKPGVFSVFWGFLPMRISRFSDRDSDFSVSSLFGGRSHRACGLARSFGGTLIV